MSSLLYGALTRKREEAPPGTSSTDNPPGVSTYVDALAALVPAEVLAVHAIIMSLATETEGGVTTITAPAQLSFWFIFLPIIAAVLYVAGLGKRPDRLDALRMLIPALAFVGWTMLQPTTAFDGIAPNFDPDSRWSVGLALAVVLGIVAGALGVKADKKVPPAPAVV